MLVLTRTNGETITIGDEVRLTVIDISGDTIKFGISAPKEVGVHREEVWRRIKEAARDKR